MRSAWRERTGTRSTAGSPHSPWSQSKGQGPEIQMTDPIPTTIRTRDWDEKVAKCFSLAINCQIWWIRDKTNWLELDPHVLKQGPHSCPKQKPLRSLCQRPSPWVIKLRGGGLALQRKKESLGFRKGVCFGDSRWCLLREQFHWFQSLQFGVKFL